MSTPSGAGPEQPGPEKQENWWNRIGTLGQALAAVAAVIAALVPVLVKTGLPGQGGDNSAHVPLPPDTVVTSTTHQPATTPASTPTERSESIDFTLSDQLTEGAEEEVIVITLEGAEVARLHATRDDPVVTQRATATGAGNYSYVVDAAIRWYDYTGTEQVTEATGRGSIAIHDGMRVDVYLHQETDGVSLSLQSATE
jgi:hypothetical protein